MAKVGASLRAAFQAAVSDDLQEDFLAWLAKVDEAAREIAGEGLETFQNPGWVELWDQDATVDEALEDLGGVDFGFEGRLLLWHGERDHA